MIFASKSIVQKTIPIVVKIISNLKKIISNVIKNMLLIIFGRFKSLITKSIQCEKLLHF